MERSEFLKSVETTMTDILKKMNTVSGTKYSYGWNSSMASKWGPWVFTWAKAKGYDGDDLDEALKHIDHNDIKAMSIARCRKFVMDNEDNERARVDLFKQIGYKDKTRLSAEGIKNQYGVEHLRDLTPEDKLDIASRHGWMLDDVETKLEQARHDAQMKLAEKTHKERDKEIAEARNKLATELDNSWAGRGISLAFPSMYEASLEHIKDGSGSTEWTDIENLRNLGADFGAAAVGVVNPVGKFAKPAGRILTGIGKKVPSATRHIGKLKATGSVLDDIAEGVGEEAIRQAISTEDMNGWKMVGSGIGSGVVGGGLGVAGRMVAGHAKGSALANSVAKGIHHNAKEDEVLIELGEKYGLQEDAIKTLTEGNPYEIDKMLRKNPEYKQAVEDIDKALEDLGKSWDIMEKEALKNAEKKTEIEYLGTHGVPEDGSFKYRNTDEYKSMLEANKSQALTNLLKENSIYEQVGDDWVEGTLGHGVKQDEFIPSNAQDILDLKNRIHEIKGEPLEQATVKPNTTIHPETHEERVARWGRGHVTEKERGTEEFKQFTEGNKREIPEAPKAEGNRIDRTEKVRPDGTVAHAKTTTHFNAKPQVTRVPKNADKYDVPDEYLEEHYKTLLDESDDLNGGAWTKEDVRKYGSFPDNMKAKTVDEPQFEVTSSEKTATGKLEYGYFEGKPSVRIVGHDGVARKPVTLGADEAKRVGLEIKPTEAKAEEPAFDPNSWENASEPKVHKATSVDTKLTDYKDLGPNPKSSPMTWVPNGRKGGSINKADANDLLEAEIDLKHAQAKADAEKRKADIDAFKNSNNLLMDEDFKNKARDAYIGVGKKILGYDPMLELQKRNDDIGKLLRDNQKDVAKRGEESFNKTNGRVRLGEYGNLFADEYVPPSETVFGDMVGAGRSLVTRASRNLGAKSAEKTIGGKKPVDEEKRKEEKKAQKAIKMETTPSALLSEPIWVQEGRMPTWEEQQTDEYKDWKVEQLLNGKGGFKVG